MRCLWEKGRCTAPNRKLVNKANIVTGHHGEMNTHINYVTADQSWSGRGSLKSADDFHVVVWAIGEPTGHAHLTCDKQISGNFMTGGDPAAQELRGHRLETGWARRNELRFVWSWQHLEPIKSAYLIFFKVAHSLLWHTDRCMMEKIIQPHLDPRRNHGFIKSAVCPFKVTAFDRNKLDDVKPLTEVSKMEGIPADMSLVVKSLPVGLWQPKQGRRKGILISHMFSLSSSRIMVDVCPLLVACFPLYLPSLPLVFLCSVLLDFVFLGLLRLSLSDMFACLDSFTGFYPGLPLHPVTLCSW